MDVRLYKKAKSVADPFEFDKYRKKKIRETIEQDRTNRVQVNKLPKVNKDLAMKLMNDQLNKKKKETATSLLNDTRFKGLFENPDFEVDKNTDEYRLLNPVLSRLDNAKKKELKKKLIAQEFEPVEVRRISHEICFYRTLEFKTWNFWHDVFIRCVSTFQDELEGKNSSEESDVSDEESSDDEHTWTQEVKKQHRVIQREHRQRELQERLEAQAKEEANSTKQPQLYELREGEEFKGINSLKRKINK